MGVRGRGAGPVRDWARAPAQEVRLREATGGRFWACCIGRARPGERGGDPATARRRRLREGGFLYEGGCTDSLELRGTPAI